MAFGSKITNVNRSGLFNLAKGYNHLRSLTFDSSDFDVRENANGIFVNVREQDGGSDFLHNFQITAVGGEDNNQITISGGMWDRTNEDSVDRNWVGLLCDGAVISKNNTLYVTKTIEEDDTQYVLLELRNDLGELDALNPTQILANVTSEALEVEDDARMILGMVTMANVDGVVTIDTIYQGWVGDVKDNLVRPVDDCSLGMWTDTPEDPDDPVLTYKEIKNWHDTTYGMPPQTSDLFLAKSYDPYGASSNCASYSTPVQIYDVGLEHSTSEIFCEKVEECIYGTNTICDWFTGIIENCDLCQWIQDNCAVQLFAHSDLTDISAGTCGDHHALDYPNLGGANVQYVRYDGSYARNKMTYGLGDDDGVGSVAVAERQLLGNSAAATLAWAEGLLDLYGNWSCSGDFDIALACNVGSNITVTGNADIGGDVKIGGDANVSGTCFASEFNIDTSNFWNGTNFDVDITGDGSILSDGKFDIDSGSTGSFVCNNELVLESTAGAITLIVNSGLNINAGTGYNGSFTLLDSNSNPVTLTFTHGICT